MSLISCKNCGHKISDKAIMCPKCGVPTELSKNANSQSKIGSSDEEQMYHTALSCLSKKKLSEAAFYISSLLTINSDDPRYQDLKDKLEWAYEGVRESKRRIKRVIVYVLSAFFIILISILGYRYYQNSKVEIEQKTWEAICNSQKIADYEDYVMKFPNGKHRSIANDRIDNIRKELKLWNEVKDRDDEYGLQEYMQKYPQGIYYDEANNRRDEALWKKAVKMNNKIGYQDYLYNYPRGNHQVSAEDRLAHLEEAEITETEANNVASVISQYFRALASGDEDSMIKCLNTTMKTYLGKSNASKVDAITYMHRLHADDVYNIKISLDNISVSKRLGLESEPEFIVSLSYDQRINREDTSRETFASFEVNAILDNRYKITSLSVKKTAKY